MNLGQIIKRVQRLFGDDSEAQITVADITDWANEGQLHIARVTECLKDVVLLDPISGSGRYNLPDNFIREDRVTYRGSKLTRTTLEEFDKYSPDRGADTSSGTPIFYWVYGSYLETYPNSSVTETDTLEMMYVCGPNPLTSSNQFPDIPAHLHEELVRFCLMRAKELNEDYDQSNRIKSELDESLLLAVDERTNPHSDSYPAVRDISYVGDYC